MSMIFSENRFTLFRDHALPRVIAEFRASSDGHCRAPLMQKAPLGGAKLSLQASRMRDISKMRLRLRQTQNAFAQESMAEEQPQQNDHRDRHAQHPQQ
ncbi:MULTISPECIES: hypothetical protein [Bradyrhizobium]|uniref:hypothetical protein n=1 Tax=Bradyrhizobium TaxID=374 RepID=UPI001ED9DFE9|nr:hypothetical protein [Bradyrhizobium zhengyangense]MCG2637551.1 hypothetical protein [Bradyrhizobium zhengyangense]